MTRPTSAAFLLALTLHGTPAIAQIASETIVRGLRTPVAVVADPTDRANLFVVEQGGVIRVVRDGTPLTEPFLDLTAEISAGGERGLLGLALSPDYADSRRFFVNFTNRDGDTVVARFLRHRDNALVADKTTRLDLMWPDDQRRIEQPFSNHNGGHLAFGRDGYLYIGLGDGGSGGDPMNMAQNPASLLGKMLRIDVSVPDDDRRGYRVPEDNPFVDGEPIRALGEIWALGLRNPWRYSFDDWTRGGTAGLTIADVGQGNREEINFEPSGGGGRNYGWRLYEGRAEYLPRTAPALLPLVAPMHEYGRSIGASVTGGVIYRGAALDPAFNGRYFYADFISGRLFSIGLHLHPITSEAAVDDEREHTAALGGRAVLGGVSSFGIDHDGELLVINYTAGTIVRVRPDLSVVPAAPVVSAIDEAGRVRLMWSASPDGVVAITFAIERVRDGAVVSREVRERGEMALEWETGDCVRVRGQNREGLAGPPSAPVCALTR